MRFAAVDGLFSPILNIGALLVWFHPNQSDPLLLDQLNSLATEQDADKRKELLSAVADLFLYYSEEHSEVDADLFQGVMGQLLDQVSVVEKSDFSARLAHSEHTPVDIAERLARDVNVDVAGAVLRHSPVLSDEVLVDVAQAQSQAHMMAISGRATLSVTVTDILVERGDQDVVRTVASNTGASVSEFGFKRLAERSQDDELLAKSLFVRTDLPKDVAVKLLGDMPADLRHKLEDLAQTNVLGASQLVQRAARAAGSSNRSARRYASSDIRRAVALVRSGQCSIDDVIVKLVKTGRSKELAAVLAELVEVPLSEVRTALNKSDFTGIAVICRQLRMARSSFESVATFVAQQLSLPQSHVAHFVNQYDSLSEEMAARVSRFVSVRRKFANSNE